MACSLSSFLLLCLCLSLCLCLCLCLRLCLCLSMSNCGSLCVPSENLTRNRGTRGILGDLGINTSQPKKCSSSPTVAARSQRIQTHGYRQLGCWYATQVSLQGFTPKGRLRSTNPLGTKTQDFDRENGTVEGLLVPNGHREWRHKVHKIYRL